VKNASETYGVARLGGRIFAARIENDGIRWKVTSLLTSDDNLTGENLGSGRLFFGVDTRLAVVKKIQIKNNSPIEASDIARFEMAQSLLDDPDRFYFDTLPLESNNGYKRFMSIAYHRDQIDELIDMYQEKLRKPSGFKLDAVALANGYNTFCRIDRGELQVLADIETDMVTLAILNQGKLYGINRLESVPGEEISSDSARKLASEFKLTLSYHQAELFQDGITVPLSRIILSGRHARDEFLTAALKDQFSTEISLPHFHDGYFEPASDTIDRYHPEQFLIPLGLGVE